MTNEIERLRARIRTLNMMLEALERMNKKEDEDIEAYIERIASKPCEEA
jgi:hypothetical protein